VKNGILTTRVTIRDRDYLREDAEAVNGVIDTYRNKMEGLHVTSSAVGTALAGLGRAIDQGSPDETRQRFGELNEKIDEIQTSLGYFKVSNRKADHGTEIPREATVEDLTPIA
jgi:hypothetical protein